MDKDTEELRRNLFRLFGRLRWQLMIAQEDLMTIGGTQNAGESAVYSNSRMSTGSRCTLVDTISSQSGVRQRERDGQFGAERRMPRRIP